MYSVYTCTYPLNNVIQLTFHILLDNSKIFSLQLLYSIMFEGAFCILRILCEWIKEKINLLVQVQSPIFLVYCDPFFFYSQPFSYLFTDQGHYVGLARLWNTAITILYSFHSKSVKSIRNYVPKEPENVKICNQTVIG